VSDHDRTKLTRREALSAGAAASAALAIPSLLPLAGPALPTALAAATLTPEQTEGPFYVALERVRGNIATGEPGVPLHLAIKIVDAATSAPVSAAAVDIWHCNASGVYSDESSDGTLGQTFLRGVQLTGADGVARFLTIYPGHYRGRTTHIHLKVHIAGASTGGKYAGGHVCHTGQLFFDDAISSKISALAAYRHDTAARLRNSADNIYTHQGGSRSRLTLRRRSGALATAGYDGSATLAVRPSATPRAA
jgi:protocatechuate 3,4-dioxygenase beta subunit